MKILIVNQYAGSPTLGMEYRPHWMSTELLSAGHDVLIVTANHSHLRSRKLPIGPQQIEGVNFLVLRTFPYSKNGVRRFLNILSFRYQLYLNSRSLRSWVPDIVIASSTHPLDIRPVARIAKQVRARFVYEVHDLWPLTLIHIGGFKEKHPLIRWMSKEESFGYKNANLVVSLLPNTKSYMVSKGLGLENWVWIPNGVSEQSKRVTPPISHTSSINNLRANFKRLIIYAGRIGIANNLEKLINHATVANQIGIAFVIVGDGPEKKRLEILSSEYCNILWLDKVSKNEIPELLSMADAAYLGLEDSALYDFGISPNKIFDYFSEGLPVIEYGNLSSSPVVQSGAGWRISEKEGCRFVDILNRIAEMDDSELKMLGDLGKSYLKNGFYHTILTKNLLIRFEELIAKKVESELGGNG